MGKKLFCAPLNASDMLMIDAETEAVHTIACGVTGEWKWNGIAAVGKKIVCAPHNASEELVIDAETETVFCPLCP